MTTFKYKALSADGAPVSGVVEAYDEFEAVSKIKQECSIVVKVTPVEENKKDGIQLGGKIKEKALAVMCSQFSIIIGSGLPIVQAVGLIADQTTDKVLKKILAEVAGDVAAGYRLAQSFEQRGPKLPTTFIETIRAGEESGTLDRSFSELHTYYDKSSKLKGKLISALTYPAFTIVVAVVVILIIMLVAVPTFTETFLDMGIALPLPTRMLIAMSNFVSKYGIISLICIAALVIALKLISKTPKGSLAFADFRMKIPVLGNVVKMKNSALFASTMATLTSSGLSMMNAVSITGKVLSNARFSDELSKAVSSIEAGKRLGDTLAAASCFPKLLVEMTSVGEETGALENTLKVVGDFYNNEVDTNSSRAISLLEPIIIVFLAVFVVFVLLSVYMPMFSMYGSM